MREKVDSDILTTKGRPDNVTVEAKRGNDIQNLTVFGKNQLKPLLFKQAKLTGELCWALHRI